MTRYLARRLLLTIPMLFGITFMTYAVIALAPGGPAAGLMTDLNPKISPEYKDMLVKEYNFDKPFYVQYAKWVWNMARLDFGTSIKDKQPIIDKILTRLPRTLLLTGLSLLLSFLLAVPLGIFSAMKQNSIWDRGITVFVFLGFSLPTYWVALLLMIFFGIQLGWFPVTGFRSILADDMSLWQQILDIARHLALPLIVTGLTGLAGLTRYMRNSMLEVIRQDYIRTARAKGLDERRVILVHALRNSLLPVITILGFSLPELISAGVIFETIFSYPGLGRLAYEAAITRDIFLIMGTVTFSAFLTLMGNLIADVAYAYADPRIRYR
jgi:peptide/nickel transport system permease protein